MGGAELASRGPYPLEPDAEAMRSMGERALEFLVRFVEGLPDAPAADLEGGLELARQLRAPPPEAGGDFEELLREFEAATAKGFNTAGPGYLAFIPGGGLFAAALADFLALGVNRFVNLWTAAPALTQVELNVVRWLCDLFGYPPGSLGILTSGGSMANFSAVVTARRALLGEDFQEGTLYASEQTHASVWKGAMLAGFPARSLRRVPVTPDLRVDVEALREMVGKDRAAGRTPFLVVANAGTVNTGAVDPMGELAALAREEGMWLHVDGAYGGFFQLTERGRRLFRGVEESDSVTLDPHKGLFLPYGTGSLIVRDGRALREAHQVEAEYLRDLRPEGELVNFADHSPELSRDFRGLRVWLPLRLHGVGAFRAALEEKLDLARYLYEELRRTPGLEVPWEPELTIVAFRLAPGARVDPAEQDRLNARLLEAVNASRRVFLSSTRIAGRLTLRACVLSHRTHRDRVEEAVDIVRRAAGHLLRR
jgi:aromatic-L-amino-acid decarboxylase